MVIRKRTSPSVPLSSSFIFPHRKKHVNVRVSSPQTHVFLWDSHRRETVKKYEFRERCVGTASLQTEATENNSELKSEDVVLKSASHLAATETAQCSISLQSWIGSIHLRSAKALTIREDTRGGSGSLRKPPALSLIFVTKFKKNK